MANTYLTRTISTSTNNTKFTISVWVKKLSQVASSYQNIINSRQSGTTSGLGLWFGNNDELFFNFGTSSTSSVSCQTNAKYRDNSAWYHIVVTGDASQSGTDKLKFWVNGEQITSFLTDNRSSFATIEYDLGDTTYPTIIGRKHDGTFQFDGQMAHFHFIDGTAYDASYFGSTDATTGIWKPTAAPSVTYGNNGFFLKFANSGSMGADSSGNSNNFTINGTLTQTQDTPSNVFCTLNPLKKHSGQTLSFLNLRSVGAGSANLVSSTLAVSQGKWYFEFKVISANAYAVFIYPYNLYKVGDDIFAANYTVGFYGTTPSLYRNGSNTGSLGGGVTDNDIIQVAMDLDNNNIYFGKNGNWNDGLGGGFDQSDFSNATGHTLTRNSSYDDIGILTLNGGSGSSYTLDWNFGNGYFGTTAVSSANADGAGYGLFEYAPPTNYYSLCTKNINTYG